MKALSENYARPRLPFLAWMLGVATILQAQAQPSLLSVVPADGATGVSASASVVFTFSDPMDTSATASQFFDFTAGGFVNPTPAWSLGNTVLTYTPSPAFPASHAIHWFLNGQDTLGDPLGESGSFVTSGTGAGTNRITTFTVGKIHSFDQASVAAPVLDALAPYDFSAATSLASNRTATNVTLMLPTSAVSNLTQNPLHTEDFFLFASNTNLANFDATIPAGNYQFMVSATASNQQVTLNLSASLVQPNAPHISNFAAAQSVNATQVFTLTWDAFSGGTSTDFVSLAIGSAFATPSPGTASALNGTATSLLLPANTLQANSNYDCSISFYHAIQTSNAAYATVAFVGSSTRFTVSTSAGAAAGPLVLTNATWTPSNFSFDVNCSTGQTLTVEYSTNLLPGTWTGFLTTNSPANRIRVSDARATTNRTLFYRAKNGS